MTRSHFQQLSKLHMSHAEALLNAALFSGAYYISGYAVECALKTSAKIRISSIFIRIPRWFNKAWTHNFPNLIEVSGLKTEFDAERQQDSDLDVNWKRRMAATWPA